MKTVPLHVVALSAVIGIAVVAYAQNSTLARTLSGEQVREQIIHHKGQDTSRDSDGDGIPDILELELGTDPTKADSDGDGTTDGIEIAHGLDPQVPNPNPDFVYLVTRLSIPPNYTRGAEPYDISNTGIVSGAAYSYSTNSKDSAVRWNTKTGAVEVALNTVDSYGWTVNDSGAIAGRYKGLALYWAPGSPARSVNRSADDTLYSAGINSTGKIVGRLASQFLGDTGAFAWEDNGTAVGAFTHLTPPAGYEYPRAEGINDKGQIIGVVTKIGSYSSQRAGALWNGSTASVMLSATDTTEAAFDSVGYISRDGTVLGYKNSQPAIWTPAGGRKYLPKGPNGVTAYVGKMNAFGEIVGSLDYQPVVWRPDGNGGWNIVDVRSKILDSEVRTSFSASSMNDAGQIVGSFTDPNNYIRDIPVLLTPILRPTIAVDANRDGVIKLASEDDSDATSAAQPYRFWLNDDFDGYGGFSPPASGAILDYTRDRIAGVRDLKDYFPVFLGLKQLLNVLPPSSGATYKLKHANGALKVVFTSLTQATAFAYKDFPYAYSNAFTYQITPEGLPLNESFLNSIKDGDQGVLLMEGTEGAIEPLVLVVEKEGNAVLEVSLPLSIGQDIVLLLHGMNSNTNTWDAFVDSASVYSWSNVADIRDGDIWGDASRNNVGVVCYRVQFGAYDLVSTRVGLENIKATDPGYDTVTRRCGDFETFAELGDEVEDAITLLLARHANARIVMVGHSRGGISARAFLQGSASTAGDTAAKAAAIGLITTSSPHRGSRLARIYGWLNTHRRDEPGTNEHDWEVVDFLRGVGFPWGFLPENLDVRRPVILDVADNSLAIAALNSATALQSIPTSIRCAEIQYANARLGVLALSPVKYSVFDGPSGPQLSSEATEFLLNGGTPSDIAFIGDGLVPRANQRFTQLTGFSAVALPARVITNTEIVHIEAPKQSLDLLEQLKVIAPRFFP